MELRKMVSNESLQKKAIYGPDVNIEEFREDLAGGACIDDLEHIPEETRKTLEMVGIDPKMEKRIGTYIQNGNKVDFCFNREQDVMVMPIPEALQKYSWLKDYLWKAVDPEADKYTAAVAIEKNIQGYFIYAKKGAKSIYPLQSCLFTQIDGFKQIVHNIVIAEEGSELNIITGCTAHGKARKALHLGVSEFFVKKNAKVTFTMVHQWQEASEVRPRTAVIIEEGGTFINNYVVMSPVKSLQSNPKFILKGPNSNIYSQTLIYGKENALYDLGGEAHLLGDNCSAELISRIVGTQKSQITSRGKIIGVGKGSKGHLECSGLLLSEESAIIAIPILEARNPDITMTHEASVGKISDVEIQYLQARGLPEEEARGLIIRGFLEANTNNLPESLAKETERLIQAVADSEMA